MSSSQRPAILGRPVGITRSNRKDRASVEDKLTEIVEFWKFQKQNWTRPSSFINSFQQVFNALVHVRDLNTNADVALERLFPNGAIQFYFSSEFHPPAVGVEAGPEVGRGNLVHAAWCLLPGQTNMIKECGKSKEVARKAVALKVLKLVLWNQFSDYCNISASSNYVGIGRDTLRLALAQALSETEGNDRNNHQVVVSPLRSNPSRTTEPIPGCNSGDNLDENILKWTPENWKVLSINEKEEILFQFWGKTSHKEFPLTMNLLRTRHAFGVCAVGAFMLLFSEGMQIRKEGVSWVTLQKKANSVKVELSWCDLEWGQMHFVKGAGSTLDIARRDAALKAFKIVYKENDLQILQHACSWFFFADEQINPEELYRRLKKAMASGRVFSEPLRIPAPGSSNGRGTELNSCRGRNPSGTTVPLASTTPQFLQNHSENEMETNSPGPGEDSVYDMAPPSQPSIAEAPQNLLNLEDPQQPSPFVPVQTQSMQPTLPFLDCNQNIQIEEDASDPFAEYFSDSPDGLISVPDWIMQKYLHPQVNSEGANCVDFSSDNRSSSQEGNLAVDTPYLPFDELIGYQFPEEASEALDLLFEKKSCHSNQDQAGPKYETCKYVLAECQVGSRTFKAFGSTMEEAKENAAAMALKALQDSFD